MEPIKHIFGNSKLHKIKTGDLVRWHTLAKEDSSGYKENVGIVTNVHIDHRGGRDLPQRDEIIIGDLVTYRSIIELYREVFYKTIILYGVGIVTAIDNKYAKVYWTNAEQFLWISLDKLTKIQSLDKLKSKYQ